MMGVAAALGLAGVAWWLVRRVWLVKEVTEAEPPASSPPPPRPRSDSGQVDPVDQAIEESFPASDPPSYAGAGGPDDIGR